MATKLKKITETKIPLLVLMAKDAGCDTELKIAKWIIGASEHWRIMGYHKIIEEMKK
jgi:hypothetical protein